MKIAVKYFGVFLTLPEKAKYIATDMDGDVWWFDRKPRTHHRDWQTEWTLETQGFGLVAAVSFHPTPIPWHETLKEVRDLLPSKVS